VWVCVCGREKECRVQSRSMNKVGRKEGRRCGEEEEIGENKRGGIFIFIPRRYLRQTRISPANNKL